MSGVFLVVRPSNIICLISNTIPQKADMLGTIVSPNKILFIWAVLKTPSSYKDHI